MGKTSIRCPGRKTWRGTPSFVFVFDQKDCSPHSSREHCSRAKHTGRTLTLYHQEQYQAQLEARERQATEAFKKLYAQRAGVESTISQAVRRTRLRRARYIGLDLQQLRQVASAAAINLARIFDWLFGKRPKETRISPFQALAAQI
jgi:hypothetical protein